MKIRSGIKISILASFALACLAPAFSPGEAFAQRALPVDDVELARKYAPVLYFHPDELFRPQAVDVLVNSARLRQQRRLWFDVNVLPDPSISDLAGYRDEGYFLDVWYGSEGVSDSKNYSSHCDHYREALSPEKDGPPIVAYAHVVRAGNPEHITIQYWLFYYFNDWFNKHEGDWEMIEVILDGGGDPRWLVLSQHHGGTRRPWGAVQIEEGTHPAAYVALGSHANYFWGDEVYLNVQEIGNTKVEIADRTGAFDRVIPEVILIPDPAEVEEDPAAWPGSEWIAFGGHWGETAPQGDFGGPLGPAEKGDQWEQPYEWGMAQPLDTDTWYPNRLRVAITGEAARDARVTLQAANGYPLSSAESLGSVALMHSDPPSDAVILAAIELPPGLPFGLIADWPEVKASQVLRYIFEGIPASPSGRATLTLQTGRPPSLFVAGAPGEVAASATETAPVSWDAPDLVWVASILPAPEVLRGITISLLAGLLPALLYVGVLYWADRYEKEPKRLLAATFLWGAVPALLIAAVVRIFYRLPADLLGPEAIEAVWTGLAAPLIEETLKGIVVVFVAVRYRREFDNVLDGIIYGAMVGLGFAMTGNTLSYLGAFLLRGFDGLGSTIIAQGLVYGLNHALYTAIFGAGLGFARLTQHPWRRRAIPLAAFVLAVLSHALHSLAIRYLVGLNPLTVAATWAGVLLIVLVMGWSLGRQRRCIEKELAGQLPDSLYRTLVEPRAGSRAQWHALRSEGIRAFRKTRRLHQLCAELAFKRMQARLFPDEPKMAEEAETLRHTIKDLVEASS